MQITFDQALHIAIYLEKGAFKQKYRDICVPIGDEAVIGIEKRGRRSAIYIKKREKYDKSIRLPLFDSTITIDELSGHVVTAIESSKLLSDMELNMSKVPAPSIEALNALKKQTIIPEETAKDEESEDEYFDEEDEKGIEEEPEEVDEEPDMTDEFDFEEIEQEEKADEKPQKTDIFEDEGDIDGIPVQMDDSDIPPVDDYNEEPMEDFESSLTKSTVNSISSGIIAADPRTRDSAMLSKIQQESYLNNIITDDLVDLTPDVTTVFKRLSDRSPERATQIYINCILYAMELYNNDAVQMSEDLNIDMRNVSLALMEHKMRH